MHGRSDNSPNPASKTIIEKSVPSLPRKLTREPPKSSSPTSTVANAVVVETPPPPPPRTNDVGRVVTNAFGKAFRIDAVVVPQGPRKNGIEVYRDRRLFESNAENALDGIVNQLPGDMLLGDFDEKRFEREFLAAMNNKIEISEEDNEDEVRRKMEMIDMKKELMAARARGESIGEIVKNLRNEVNKMAELRDNLISELVTIKKSQATPEEIEEYYQAANKILADRGVRPIYSPATIKEKLQAAKLRKAAERESSR